MRDTETSCYPNRAVTTKIHLKINTENGEAPVEMSVNRGCRVTSILHPRGAHGK